MVHGEWYQTGGGGRVPGWVYVCVIIAAVVAWLVKMLLAIWWIIVPAAALFAATGIYGALKMHRRHEATKRPLWLRLDSQEAPQLRSRPAVQQITNVTNVNLFGDLPVEEIARIVAAQQQLPGGQQAIKGPDV
jgi:hypothetical protein